MSFQTWCKFCWLHSIRACSRPYTLFSKHTVFHSYKPSGTSISNLSFSSPWRNAVFTPNFLKNRLFLTTTANIIMSRQAFTMWLNISVKSTPYSCSQPLITNRALYVSVSLILNNCRLKTFCLPASDFLIYIHIHFHFSASGLFTASWCVNINSSVASHEIRVGQQSKLICN